jgi:hypothetical protein
MVFPLMAQRFAKAKTHSPVARRDPGLQPTHAAGFSRRQSRAGSGRVWWGDGLECQATVRLFADWVSERKCPSLAQSEMGSPAKGAYAEIFDARPLQVMVL